MAELVHEWNVWETQTIVFLSFMLQLFLLATGSLRRRNTNIVLTALIWLAYVGADLVAVYALGLFSQYEDKYKLGRDSFGDTLPFLWVPFLLVHLGGQDSITAFSIEDNSLWLRHLLNLATQGGLAFYVFWKSFHRINYSILVPAMLVFVSGIIKYGERVWALKSASRNGLGELVKFNPPMYPSKESYALQMVLLARGLFVGRTVLQLGDNAQEKLEKDFEKKCQDGEDEKLKMVMVVMELGMMFDLLYTKANVLQRWTGVVFRCASQTLMAVAFLLFLLIEKGAHNHNRVNVAITYTLFSGAMFMEACSVAVVMASPWTRAHCRNESSFLHGLCNFATSIFKAVQCNKGHRMSLRSSSSMGQFNYMDYCIAMKYKPRLMSKAISAIGLDKQWRNLWYVHHIVDDASRRAGEEGIISGVMEILGRPNNSFLGHYTSSVLGNEPDSGSPFEPEPYGPLHLEKSLMEIKEMWLRLLVYAAGKCRGELHARQLSEGGELITFVWLLMVHHGLGDVARELSLLTSDDPNVAQPGSTVSIGNSNWITRQQGPCYAFEFPGHQQSETAGVSRESQSIQLDHMLQHLVPHVFQEGWSLLERTGLIGGVIRRCVFQQLLSAQTQQDGATAAPGGASEQDEAGTSGEAGQDDDAVTTSEIHEQEPVMNAVENEGSRHA